MPDEAPAPPVPSPPLRLVRETLFQARQISLFGEIDHAIAERVCAELLALDALAVAPIQLFVSSPGGHVESGDALHDSLGFVRSPVTVIGTGWVGSAAALVYVGVPRERRLALPNTRFLLHEPSGGARGRFAEVELEVEQIVRIRARLERIFARETGRSVEELARVARRNLWLEAEEARDFGLVGRIVKHATEL